MTRRATLLQVAHVMCGVLIPLLAVLMPARPAWACHCDTGDCPAGVVPAPNDKPFCVCDEHPAIAVTAGSTTNGSLGCCNDWQNWPYYDVFYEFVPECTGLYTIDMCGSTGDTALRVYDACSVNALIASADDQCSAADPSLTIPLGAGTRYWIECGSRSTAPFNEANPGTPFVLHVSACVPECSEDIDESGDVGFGDLLSILSNWGPCAICPEDLDGDGIVGFSDLLMVLSVWGPCG